MRLNRVSEQQIDKIIVEIAKALFSGSSANVVDKT
jgi:hypothetical protein